MSEYLNTLAGSARRSWRTRREPRFRQRAVTLIESLKAENDRLRQDLARANERITALSESILEKDTQDSPPVLPGL